MLLVNDIGKTYRYIEPRPAPSNWADQSTISIEEELDLSTNIPSDNMDWSQFWTDYEELTK